MPVHERRNSTRFPFSRGRRTSSVIDRVVGNITNSGAGVQIANTMNFPRIWA